LDVLDWGVEKRIQYLGGRGRGDSVKVVAWKIDKKLGIMQMIILEKRIMRVGGR
jgi:hypothetical protein